MASLTDLWKKGTDEPLASDLVEGGLAIDVANKNVYSKGNDGNIFQVGGTSIPDATGRAFNELATDGTSAAAMEWSPFRMSPKSISEDLIVSTGSNASIGSFTLEDTFTITVEDGASLIVV